MLTAHYPSPGNAAPSSVQMLSPESLDFLREIGEQAAHRRFNELMAAEQRQVARGQYVPTEEAIQLMGGCTRFTLNRWRNAGRIIGKRIKGLGKEYQYQVGSIEDAIAANSIAGKRKWSRDATKQKN